MFKLDNNAPDQAFFTNLINNQVASGAAAKEWDWKPSEFFSMVPD